MPISLFWATYGPNKSPEEHFKFPFIMIVKLTLAFLTGQSRCVLKSWYTGGDPEEGFWHCFADGLNQSFVSLAAEAFTRIGAPFESFYSFFE